MGMANFLQLREGDTPHIFSPPLRGSGHPYLLL